MQKLFELYTCPKCGRMRRAPIQEEPPKHCNYVSYPVRARLAAQYGSEDAIPVEALGEASCGGRLRLMSEADKIKEALAWR